MSDRHETLRIWDALVSRNNPLDPAPDRWGRQREAYKGQSVYVGQYSQAAFPNRAAFQAFCWYTSSAQQEILAEGPSAEALEWFVPEPTISEHLLTALRLPPTDEREIRRALSSVSFGEELAWVREVKFVDAVLSVHDELNLVGQTTDGWLQLFTVYD